MTSSSPGAPLACSILRTTGCDTLNSGSSRRVCAKFASAFLAPLLGSRNLKLATLSQLVSNNGGGPYVCFSQLMVGGAFDAFNSEEV